MASRRCVAPPCQSISPVFLRGAASPGRQAPRAAGPRAGTAGLLGDFDLPARLPGGSCARVGGSFRRDAARPGPPGNCVRVLLYRRVDGLCADSSVGYLDAVDSLRMADRRVTTALARELDEASVLAVRSDLKLVGPSNNRALHDVIEGMVGRGAVPMTVLDSLVVDSLTPDLGRNVVVTAVPQALRSWLDGLGRLLPVLPAAAELSDATSNLILALPWAEGAAGPTGR